MSRADSESRGGLARENRSAVAGLGLVVWAMVSGCAGLRPPRDASRAPANDELAHPRMAAMIQADGPEGDAPNLTWPPAPALTLQHPRGEGDVRAHAYAALEATACARMLRSRNVSFVYVDRAAGVNAPIRLSGPLHGVDIHSEPKRSRATSPYEILDCRLALALDDFTAMLSAYGVVEAIHMSMYRPPPGGVARSGKHSQHEAGLAIDIGALVLRDGSRLVVEQDWNGGIDKPTCGPDAMPRPSSSRARLLRSILCRAAETKMFNLYLTPNFNYQHRNHFHLEVTRGAKWFIVH